MNESPRAELLAIRAEDARAPELVEANTPGGSYVPRMEAVHVGNAARLRALVAVHGWPAEELAGEDGAEAAWLIAQHAVGEPDVQRAALAHPRHYAAAGRVPAWHAAYLEDRIAMHEGRPRRCGTWWLDGPLDGRALVEPGRVGPRGRAARRRGSSGPSATTGGGGSSGSPARPGGTNIPRAGAEHERRRWRGSRRPAARRALAAF